MTLTAIQQSPPEATSRVKVRIRRTRCGRIRIVRAYVGVTDARWADFLIARPELDEVNFWRPSAKQAFAALKPGEPFLFKTHHPHNKLIGGGFFEGFVPLRVSEAWNFFAQGNGVGSSTDLRLAISRYRRD